MQISIDALLRTSAIHQNLSMNLKEIKSGNGKNNIKRYLKNQKKRLQVNQYLFFLEEKEISG